MSTRIVSVCTLRILCRKRKRKTRMNTLNKRLPLTDLFGLCVIVCTIFFRNVNVQKETKKR